MRVHELARDQAGGEKKKPEPAKVRQSWIMNGSVASNLPCGVRWQMFAVGASPDWGRVLN
jgi:hypothetical protein